MLPTKGGAQICSRWEMQVKQQIFSPHFTDKSVSNNKYLHYGSKITLLTIPGNYTASDQEIQAINLLFYI